MSWSCLPCVLVLLQMEIIMSLDHLPRVGLFIYLFIIFNIISSGLDGAQYYMLSGS